MKNFLFQSFKNESTQQTIVVLLISISIGLVLRVIFTPWDLPPEAPDVMIYLSWAVNYSNGFFEPTSLNFLWPATLSVIFQFMDSEKYFDYVTVMRICSVIFSTITIPIVYFISKKVLTQKYALISSIIFAVEPNLIINSTIGITEPLFIFISCLIINYFANTERKIFLLTFFLAGLAFSTRLSGIVFLIILIILVFNKIKQHKKKILLITLGIMLFLVGSSPYSIGLISEKEIPFIHNFQIIEKYLNERNNPNLIGVSDIFSESSSSMSPIEKTTAVIMKEAFHLIKLGIPVLIFFTPIGFYIILKNGKSEEKKFILLTILILLIALPQYLASPEFRNLFLLIPLFSIFSAIGMERIFKFRKFENHMIIMILVFFVVISMAFLTETSKSDNSVLLEKERFGEYVVQNFEGTLMGDYDFIIHHIPDFSKEKISYTKRDNLDIVPNSAISINSLVSLDKLINENEVDFLIIDNVHDNRFPIFNELFEEKHEKQYKKIFDSFDKNYKRYHVKIFEVNN